MATSKPTSYLSSANHFLPSLSLDLGTLDDGQGSCPFDYEASPPQSNSPRKISGIRSLIGLSSVTSIQTIQCSTSEEIISRARPKAISGRTSYYQARLAFHYYPQLIRKFCTAYRFGPPADYSSTFTLAMGSSPGFGSSRHLQKRAFNTRFPFVSGP